MKYCKHGILQITFGPTSLALHFIFFFLAYSDGINISVFTYLSFSFHRITISFILLACPFPILRVRCPPWYCKYVQYYRTFPRIVFPRYIY